MSSDLHLECDFIFIGFAKWWAKMQVATTMAQYHWNSNRRPVQNPATGN